MIEVIVLAIALSMDAFAVSIGLGTKHSDRKLVLALTAGLYFGFSQGIMPLIGYAAGISLLHWIGTYASWIAFILLVFVGGKMICESRGNGIEENIAKINHKMMFILAIATSIDAMVAGFTLTLLAINLFLACLIIGFTSFISSGLGVVIGAKSGSYLESKAELLGGTVLILIGFKILLF